MPVVPEMPNSEYSNTVTNEEKVIRSGC